MEEIHVNVKRIGNSLGVILPKEMTERLSISEGSNVHLAIERAPKLLELAGTFKSKRSTQELKDEAREGWGE